MSNIILLFYSESLSLSDFNFAINSASDSESESESKSSSVLINFDTCIFFILYSHSSK